MQTQEIEQELEKGQFLTYLDEKKAFEMVRAILVAGIPRENPCGYANSVIDIVFTLDKALAGSRILRLIAYEKFRAEVEAANPSEPFRWPWSKRKD
ncbi:hypothetical protein [Burkholderia sp. TSV86]|uniref:hypothetical protein n=1 Tax=Burkholderia sp. TSV86 TaxID=1385594 RepID=UPI0012E33029|nr:hypothetical protein [Burkholderia sp. TSV86]